MAAGLPGYAVVDLTVARDIGRNIQAFVGAQNLFDADYFVQTNPSTVGTPQARQCRHSRAPGWTVSAAIHR